MTVPVSLFDSIIGVLDFLGQFSQKMEDAAELARIGKYYAVEDMLTTSPAEKYGKVTLQNHYERIADEGQVRTIIMPYLPTDEDDGLCYLITQYK